MILISRFSLNIQWKTLIYNNAVEKCVFALLSALFVCSKKNMYYNNISTWCKCENMCCRLLLLQFWQWQLQRIQQFPTFATSYLYFNVVVVFEFNYVFWVHTQIALQNHKKESKRNGKRRSKQQIQLTGEARGRVWGAKWHVDSQCMHIP